MDLTNIAVEMIGLAKTIRKIVQFGEDQIQPNECV